MPAVTLDLWHTLLYLPPDDEEEYMRAQSRLATRYLSSAPRTAGAPALSEGEMQSAFDTIYAEAVSAAGQGRTVTPAQQLLRAGAATGRRPDVTPYLAELREIVQRLEFVRAPGALEFLAALGADGYRLGLISNTVGEPGAFLQPVLRSLGLDRYLETLVFSDELPWTKPAPEIFRTALDRLGSTPADAVHVGDGWSDIEGARRAGYRAGILFTGLQQYGARYKALFLPDGWDRPATDHVADRFDRVLDLIRRILPVTGPSS